MNKKTILKIILIVFIIIFVLMTVIVFKISGKVDLNLKWEIDNSTEKIEIEDIDYINEYSNQIIKSNVTSYDYEFIKNDKYLYGKFYIDENSKLYVTDDFRNIKRNLTNDKIVTLYKVINVDSISIYAIPSDYNKVYSFTINETDIDKVEKKEYLLNSKIKSFTYLESTEYGDEEKSPVVLCEDNKMYDLSSGLLYSNEYTKFYKNFILDSNNIIYSYNGYKMYDFTKNQYKLVGYILSSENSFTDSSTVLLVTEDGSILWYNGYESFYAYNKRVKSIDSKDGKVTITFGDKTHFTFNGEYKKYS